MVLTLTIVLSLSAVTYALIEKPGQNLGIAIIAALRARRSSPIAQAGSPVLQSHPWDASQGGACRISSVIGTGPSRNKSSGGAMLLMCC